MDAESVVEGIELDGGGEGADAELGRGCAAVFADGEVRAAEAGAEAEGAAVGIDGGKQVGGGLVELVEQVLDRDRAGKIDGIGLAAVGDLQTGGQVEGCTGASGERSCRGEGDWGIAIVGLIADAVEAGGEEGVEGGMGVEGGRGLVGGGLPGGDMDGKRACAGVEGDGFAACGDGGIVGEIDGVAIGGGADGIGFDAEVVVVARGGDDGDGPGAEEVGQGGGEAEGGIEILAGDRADADAGDGIDPQLAGGVGAVGLGDLEVASTWGIEGDFQRAVGDFDLEGAAWGGMGLDQGGDVAEGAGRGEVDVAGNGSVADADRA